MLVIVNLYNAVAAISRRRNLSMAILIAVAALAGSTVALVLIGQSRALNGWVKAALIGPIVLFVVYCLARIPNKEDQQEKASEKSSLVQAFERQSSK